jgi:hypothetical protein
MNSNAVIIVMITVNPRIFLVHHQTMLSWVPVLPRAYRPTLPGHIFINYRLDTVKKLLRSNTSNTVVICNLAAGCPDVSLCGGQAKDPYLNSAHTIDLQLQLTIKAWKSTDPAPHSIHVETIPVQSLFFEMHHPPCPIHSHHIYFPLSRKQK